MIQPNCQCLDQPLAHLDTIRELGMDSHYAEVSVLICRQCGQLWLKYFFELEAFTGSGRWYLGPITPDQRAVVTTETAKDILEDLDWYYYGGSYFIGGNGKTSGSIFLP